MAGRGLFRSAPRSFQSADRGTMRSVPVVMLLAAVAIVGGVILVALGRGGVMASFPADQAPFPLGQLTAADIALLQPPRSIWGYNPQVTEAALQAVARVVTERDLEIERLRHELARLRGWPAGERPAGVGDERPAGMAGERPAGMAGEQTPGVARERSPGVAGEWPAGEQIAGERPAGEQTGGECAGDD